MQKMRKAVATLIAVVICIATAIPVSAATYQGIDVSKWQPNYDFAKAKSDGAQIVYLRSSLAESVKDTSFDRHYAKAKAAGLLVGAYHFFYDGAGNTVDGNLENAVATVQGKTFDCRYVVDVEGEGYRENLSKAKLTADVLEFADKFTKQTGLPCALYSSTYFIKDHFTSDIAKLPVWIADYRGRSSGLSQNQIYSNYAGWQYSDNGAFGNCLVDSSHFYDSILLSKPITVGTPEPIQPTAPTTIKHHVGEDVTYSYCFSASDSPLSSAIPASRMYLKHGVITEIVEGRDNPYLIGNGICWVNDSAISGGSTAPAPTPAPARQSTTHSIGEEVTFTTCYRSSTDPTSEAIPASRMSVHRGKITKVLPGRHNPYLLDNGLCWVNDGDISSSGASSSSNNSGISVGNTVSIRSGAVYGGVWKDRGASIPTWVLSGKYRVEQISTHNGVREALLSGIDSWVSTSKLYRR